MKRLIYQNLLEWKKNTNKKPLMVYGARQVGKSYILEEFCKKGKNKCQNTKRRPKPFIG